MNEFRFEEICRTLQQLPKTKIILFLDMLIFIQSCAGAPAVNSVKEGNRPNTVLVWTEDNKQKMDLINRISPTVLGEVSIPEVSCGVFG